MIQAVLGFVAGMGMAVTWLNAKFEDKKLGKYLYSINTNNSYNYELSNEVKSMCSTYVPFSLMPEDLERMAKESGIFYCMSCNLRFRVLRATDFKIFEKTHAALINIKNFE
jgi:hypothetical protein